MLKVLAISGSLRKESYNRKALQVAKKFAAELGADVSEIDLKELNLPIYDGDIADQGLPESVLKLKKAVEDNDIIMFASPEYNYSISGALKNAIDWGTRGEKQSFDSKVAIIFGASTGILGTVRGQFQLRHILLYMNMYILAQPEVFIGLAHTAFNEDGSLKDEKMSNRLKDLIDKSFKFAEKLKAG